MLQNGILKRLINASHIILSVRNRKVASNLELTPKQCQQEFSVWERLKASLPGMPPLSPKKASFPHQIPETVQTQKLPQDLFFCYSLFLKYPRDK